MDPVSDDHNNPNYRGSWSVYPYFKPKKYEEEYSDIMISQNINTGLYVLRHNININDIFSPSMSPTSAPFLIDDDDSEFWTQNIVITFSTIGALVLLLILTMITIYLYKVSTKNKNGDEAALIDHKQ